MRKLSETAVRSTIRPSQRPARLLHYGCRGSEAKCFRVSVRLCIHQNNASVLISFIDRAVCSIFAQPVSDHLWLIRGSTSRTPWLSMQTTAAPFGSVMWLINSTNAVLYFHCPVMIEMIVLNIRHHGDAALKFQKEPSLSSASAMT